MGIMKLIIVLTLVTLASCRLSWYYADQGKNYHPPYDKNVNTNSFNGTNPDVCVNSYTCPEGQAVVVNETYVPTITRTCPVPGWVGGSTTALTQFNGCCLRYYSCLQVCGVKKAFCDGQFYGCAYTSCDPERNLRPGDRVYCRQLSSCMASWLSRASSCQSFNDIQTRSCTCRSGPSISGAPSTVPSQSPFIPNSFPPAKRQAGTISDLPTPSTTASATTPSSIPSESSATTPSATSPSTVPVISRTSDPSPSPYDIYQNREAALFGQYFVRPIPVWELFQNRCPPNFENYVAVFTDQEQDDVGYFGASSSSSLSSWTQLF